MLIFALCANSGKLSIVSIKPAIKSNKSFPLKKPRVPFGNTVMCSMHKMRLNQAYLHKIIKEHKLYGGLSRLHLSGSAVLLLRQ